MLLASNFHCGTSIGQRPRLHLAPPSTGRQGRPRGARRAHQGSAPGGGPEEGEDPVRVVERHVVRPAVPPGRENPGPPPGPTLPRRPSPPPSMAPDPRPLHDPLPLP